MVRSEEYVSVGYVSVGYDCNVHLTVCLSVCGVVVQLAPFMPLVSRLAIILPASGPSL